MVSILTLNKQVCQNFFVIHGPDFPGCKQDLSVSLIGILCRSGGARLGAESWQFCLQEDRIAQDTDPRKSLSQR
jgi:hypothetical protein